MRGRVVLATLAVTLSVTGCGVGEKFKPALLSSCTVHAEGGDVALNVDQMANAATISAVGVRRQLPDRAVVVALATALQESKLTNLNSGDGDRDSVGLFQQRPSQGWGDPKQLNDPRYAAGEFYDHLVGIDGWLDMRVTDAAQAVQHSGAPEEYQKWAAEAETLTGALVGAQGASLSCSLHDGPAKRGTTAMRALTDELRLDWGRQAQTDTSDGTGLQITPTGQRSGWQIAHWMVAHAQADGIEQVRYGARQWTVQSGGWHTVKSGQAASDTAPPVQARVYATKKK
ncbi:MAG: hypothetical protein WCA46_30070 [Actinocatenispora sp.]